jgi:hypothetical protein
MFGAPTRPAHRSSAALDAIATLMVLGLLTGGSPLFTNGSVLCDKEHGRTRC